MADPQPITWNGLPDINQITPFGTSDDECLNEIRLVLEKHGRTDRFGVALLHRHFEIADEEILVENVDVAERTLVTKRVKSGEVMQERLKPVWRFAMAGGALPALTAQQTRRVAITDTRSLTNVTTECSPHNTGGRADGNRKTRLPPLTATIVRRTIVSFRYIKEPEIGTGV